MSPAHIPIAADYDHGLVVRFLRPRAIPGVEVFADGTYSRSLRIDAAAHVLTLAAHDAGVQASITPQVPQTELQHIVRTMVGADDDLSAFRAHVGRDRILGPLVAKRPGVRLIRFVDAFEGIVRAILGQQVSLAAAATTAGRLVALLGETVQWDGPPLRAFPSPSAFAQTSEDVVRSVGLTRSKTATLRGCAQAIVNRDLDLQQLATMPGPEAEAALRRLPGIGPWTANYIRMRVFGDTDAFPASDLGVLKALQRIKAVEHVSAREAEAIAEPWRPWRAYAAIHLWASLSDT